MLSIFFDLDGVLANFVAGALRHHKCEGLRPAEIRWGIEAQLGLSPAAFWGGLGFDFWANLDPYPDGMALLGVAETLVEPERIGLLTSPCDTDGCVDGKRAWVAKHLPAYRRRLFVGSAKELFAGPTKILVDDHGMNCVRFMEAGGHAITPPRPWNAGAARCVDGDLFNVEPTVRELKSVLARARGHTN